MEQKTGETHFYYSWKKPVLDKSFKTGVSLHGHTWHSFESLSFLPGITNKISPLRRVMRWVEKRYEQKWHQPFDYSKGYWTSPVSPQAAHALESQQIEKYNLNPLVSFTDHDAIRACQELRSGKNLGKKTVPDTLSIPVSVEWTAPYKNAVLHIGIHNLPPDAGPAVLEKLHAYTAAPKPAVLKSILAELNSFPEALVILNHPLSDQGRIGFEIHESLVQDFLKANTGLVHALEINAMQSWDINRRVARIKETFPLPLIAGGDRHGFEPNGVINLTNAKTFPEFVNEIRHEKISSLLFMPQYRKSLIHRYAENVELLMREYPDLPGRTFWYDRVFYQCPDGVTRALSQMFDTDNTAIKVTDAMRGVLGLANRAARPVSPIWARSEKTMEKE
jgi:hypothetical protein